MYDSCKLRLPLEEQWSVTLLSVLFHELFGYTSTERMMCIGDEADSV